MNILGYILATLVYFVRDCYSHLSNYNNCIFNVTDLNNVTAEYNLTWFHLETETFIVEDESSHDDFDAFKYEFNICGPIPTSRWNDPNANLSYCTDSSDSRNPCVSFNSENETCIEYFNVSNSIASSVQLDTYHENCHWIGVEIDLSYNMSNYSISLYDTDDSASGIKYTILNGEYCETSNINRELIIELICPDADSNRIDFDPSVESIIDEPVVEYPDCIYTITYESSLACPNQCIAQKIKSSVNTNQYSVCNGNGVCSADPNAGFVRCLCYEGYTGDLCDEKITTITTTNSTNTNGNNIIDNGSTTTNDSLYVVIIVIFAFLFVIACTMVIFLYMRLTKNNIELGLDLANKIKKKNKNQTEFGLIQDDDEN